MNKLLVVLLVLLTVLSACTSQIDLKTASLTVDTNDGPKRLSEGLAVGNTPPDFSLTSVDGKTVNLKDLNKPVLVYFFATWCPYCAEDFSSLSEIYNSYKDDVTIVASSLDLDEDSAKISSYKSKYAGLEGAIFAEGKESMLKDYNVRYTTTKYAIGKDGTILYAGSGPLSKEQWITLLDTLKNS